MAVHGRRAKRNFIERAECLSRPLQGTFRRAMEAKGCHRASRMPFYASAGHFLSRDEMTISILDVFICLEAQATQPRMQIGRIYSLGEIPVCKNLTFAHGPNASPS